MHTNPDRETPSPFLEDCLEQMSASEEWFTTRVLPLSLDQLRWRPRSGAWSIAECLDHLNRTLAFYLPKVEQAIQGARQFPAPPGSLPAFPASEAAFLAQFDYPVRCAWSAPPPLLPSPAAHPDLIVEQFPQLRLRYARTVLSASELDLAATSISGAIHPPVQSLGGILALLAAHDRRHLAQAARVRYALKFPACPAGMSS